MNTFEISGGEKLKGEIIPQGAKNECLQILLAVLLTAESIIVKISKSKEINLYDSKMKKLAKFKSFKEFIEEEI